ncbi:MAG: hypothetical protein H6822_10610 [Planctomycetaceae bacterium]|nr:hypothetical protein [Planctomycetales bacterium]MCB9922624.1 hypothetical protein [Planctomycetaceae bacterium]
MLRSIITVLAFTSAGSVCLSPEASAQFSYGFGGSSSGYGGHGGYKTYQTWGGNHGGGNYGSGQSMSWSFGNGNGGFNIGVGPGAATFGNGTGRPNCPNGGCTPPKPQWPQPPRKPQITYPQPQQPPQWRETPVEPDPPAQVRPNEVPDIQQLPPAAVDPHENTIDLVGREMKPDELERAKTFFQDRLLELIDRLARRIPPVECDDNAIIGLMCRHGVSGNVQVELLDLLKSGNCDKAEMLWLKWLPKCKVPFHRCPTIDGFQRFRFAIRQRRPACGELKWIVDRIPVQVLQGNGCCTADDLVAQLEQECRIYDAMLVEPSRPVVNVSYRQGGKDQQFALAGQTAMLPTGIVTLVYHPNLPDGSTVVVNSQMVMIGTGGRGSFHVDKGYVAEALGHRIETGNAVAARQSELVRSGILLLNPTGTKINFVVDNRELSLDAGYQRTVETNDTVTVAFDTGVGRTTRYTLEPGTYRFRIADGAWDLNRAKFQVVIDNQENTTAFHYIVQGKHATAAVGKSNKHDSDYPIVIRYDRGNGSATKQVYHDKKDGTLFAAVNASDHLWDLFDADAAPTNASQPTAMPIAQQESSYIPAF